MKAVKYNGNSSEYSRKHKYSGGVIKGTPVQTIRERLYCSCGEGELVFTGNQQLGHGVKPPLMEHVCDKCGDFIFLKDESYPRIGYQDVL